MILLPTFKAADFLALAARERMTHTLIVPAMYNLCLLQPDFARYDLSAWRIGGYGGAPMPTATIERLAERLPGLALMNAYGATETTSPISHDAAGGDRRPRRQRRPRGAGRRRSSPSTRTGARCRRARSASSGIDGPSVVKGYWGNPEATAQKLRRRLLALGRPRHGRRGRLRARARPQEGHDQPRRLQDLHRRGRGRARRPPGGGRERGRGEALPGARRARARLRRRAERRIGRGPAPVLRRAPRPTTRCPRASPSAPSRCRATPTARWSSGRCGRRCLVEQGEAKRRPEEHRGYRPARPAP